MSDVTTRLLLELFYLTTKLNRKMEKLMVTQAEVAADVGLVKDQLVKVGLETATLIDRIADLETAVANQADASPELVDAVAALKAQAQLVDDLVPDAPTA